MKTLLLITSLLFFSCAKNNDPILSNQDLSKHTVINEDPEPDIVNQGELIIPCGIPGAAPVMMVNGHFQMWVESGDFDANGNLVIYYPSIPQSPKAQLITLVDGVEYIEETLGWWLHFKVSGSGLTCLRYHVR